MRLYVYRDAHDSARSLISPLDLGMKWVFEKCTTEWTLVGVLVVDDSQAMILDSNEPSKVFVQDTCNEARATYWQWKNGDLPVRKKGSLK